MSKSYQILYTLLGILLPVFIYGQAFDRCSTMDNLERLEKKYPNLKVQMQRIEDFTKQQNFQNRKSYDAAEIIQIPVVVHVLYNDNKDTNISEDLIHSQIEVLNQDFRRLNQDTIYTPAMFQSVAGDIGIEFCLANVDPNGFQTNGITRTFTNISSFATDDKMKFDVLGGKDAWHPESYLNIWICDLSGGTLGYAQFPGGPLETDGVVIDYSKFGVFESTTTIYNKGRTTTHEVGHWLNLKHIWGDGNCDVDDFVQDTPSAAEPNYTSGNCIFPAENSCWSSENDLPDMFQNFMDYSADACMNLFTRGQSTRIRSLFQQGGVKNTFLYSIGCNGNGLVGTCEDKFQNGDEEGIDCGGNSCQVCEKSYCNLFGDSEYEWIEKVHIKSNGNLQLAPFTNQSAQNNGYESFLEEVIYLESGAPLSLTLSPGFADDAYAEFWKIWIDFNDDKDFEDEGELIFSADDVYGDLVIQNLIIPQNVMGERRMRVAMNYDYFDENNKYACGALLFGEVEDYRVFFTSCTPLQSISANYDGDQTLTVEWQHSEQASLYDINLYVLNGSLPYWYRDTIISNSLTLENIDFDQSAIIYYKIRARCPQNWTTYFHGKLSLKNSEVRKTEPFSFKLYPTVSTDEIVLLKNESQVGNIQYRIVNALGKTVLRGKMNDNVFQQEVNITELSNGLYYITIFNESLEITKKFFKT